MLQMIQRADDAAKGGRAVYGRRTYFHKTVHKTVHRAVHMTVHKMTAYTADRVDIPLAARQGSPESEGFN